MTTTRDTRRFRSIPSLAPLFFLALLALLPAQPTYRSIAGTYDHDGDGWSEFLSVEIGPSTFPETARYVEIDGAGDHTELWSHNPGAILSAALVSDMDGDGTPEVAISTIPFGEGSATTSSVAVFPWIGGTFASRPSTAWSSPSARPRITSLATLDTDGDGRSEFAAALGSPAREIHLLALDAESDPPVLKSVATLRAPALSSGYGPIHLAAIDEDRDGDADLVAVTATFTTVSLTFFRNNGGRWNVGSSARSALPSQPASSSVTGTAVADVDQDGRDDLFLLFHNGQAAALSLHERSLPPELLPPPAAALVNVSSDPMTSGDVNALLLGRAEGGISSLKSRRVTLQTLQPATEERNAPNVPAEPETITSAPVAEKPSEIPLDETAEESPPTSGEWTIQREEPSAPVPDASQVAEQVPPAPAGAEEVAAEPVPPVSAEEGEEPAATEPTGSMRRVTLVSSEPAASETAVGDTITVGAPYVIPLATAGKSFRSFQPNVLPVGAAFDPATRAIIWTPADDQVGSHRVAFTVSYELLGARPAVQETESGVSVEAPTETVEVDRTIVVNPATP